MYVAWMEWLNLPLQNIEVFLWYILLMLIVRWFASCKIDGKDNQSGNKFSESEMLSV